MKVTGDPLNVQHKWHTTGNIRDLVTQSKGMGQWEKQKNPTMVRSMRVGRCSYTERS